MISSESKVRSDLDDDDYLKNLKDSILYYEKGTFVTRSPALAKKTGCLDKGVEGKR
jgi:hypothetical protein